MNALFAQVQRVQRPFYAFPPDSMLGMFLWFAILCVIAWGVYELYKWSQWKLPYPVIVVGIVLFCIFIIILMFRLFQMALEM